MIRARSTRLAGSVRDREISCSSYGVKHISSFRSYRISSFPESCNSYGVVGHFKHLRTGAPSFKHRTRNANRTLCRGPKAAHSRPSNVDRPIWEQHHNLCEGPCGSEWLFYQLQLHVFY